MAITHLTIHQLTNTQATKELNLSTDLLEADDQIRFLMGEVKTSFNNRSVKRHGMFADESGSFKALMQNWISHEINFLQFTQKVMDQLSLRFEQEAIETDSHWLFAEETLESETRLWFFQLKHKSGLSLTSNLELTESKLIDFSRLGFGACFNLSQFSDQGQHQNYSTLSFGFGDKALQAMLIEFVNFVDTVDAAADTHEFMSVISSFSQTLPEDKAADYRKQAAEFCLVQEKDGETVAYKELAQEMETGSPEDLVNFIQQQSPEIKDEFIPDRKSLKRFIRYSGKSKEVSISFSNEILGKHVKFDPNTESLTITALPQSLLKQLKSE